MGESAGENEWLDFIVKLPEARWAIGARPSPLRPCVSDTDPDQYTRPRKWTGKSGVGGGLVDGLTAMERRDGCIATPRGTKSALIFCYNTLNLLQCKLVSSSIRFTVLLKKFL
jgi:hypothetical protein